MKLFKRLAAVLLAGTMALAMLTACGGGDQPDTRTDEQKAEDAYVVIYNTMLGTDLKNDETLQAKAKNYLDASVTDEGAFAAGKGVMMPLNTAPDADGNISFFIVAADENQKPLGLTSEQMAKFNDTAALKASAEEARAALKKTMIEQGAQASEVDAMFDQMAAAVKAIGVGAVKKADGKVYIGTVVTMNVSAMTPNA